MQDRQSLLPLLLCLRLPLSSPPARNRTVTHVFVLVIPERLATHGAHVLIAVGSVVLAVVARVIGSELVRPLAVTGSPTCAPIQVLPVVRLVTNRAGGIRIHGPSLASASGDGGACSRQVSRVLLLCPLPRPRHRIGCIRFLRRLRRMARILMDSSQVAVLFAAALRHRYDVIDAVRAFAMTH